ncbi:MAG: pirin family protein [Pseudomonadota bacterium]
MSAQDCNEPTCTNATQAAIAQVITPVARDLGEFSVKRVLPAPDQRRVGPFIFFDHMGPAEFPPGGGINVRPHPHIGLSTLTYLFEGSILHRDSLGYVQPIEPGAVNWMTAGRGIVHSERTPDNLKTSGYSLHGIQSWIALPDGQEEIEPSFDHHPASSLPTFTTAEGVHMTLIAGSAYGQQSPVQTHSRLFYLHADAPAGSLVLLPDEFEERALYIVSGEVTINEEQFGAGRMVIFTSGTDVRIRVTESSRLMLLGGEPLASDRIVWWNFSASSPARLEQAKADWREGRFGSIAGESDFIPLPE